MGSSTGVLFRLTTFGESHGGGVGVVVDGCPPGLPLTIEDIQPDLDRRRPGQSRLVTQRDESDAVSILSGISDGVTLGTPIAMVVANRDQNSGAYEHLRDVYRPSHADFTYQAKYGIRAVAGGGRASARETIGRVAAAAIARRLLVERAGITVVGWVESIGGIDATVDSATVTMADVEAHDTRCPDPAAAEFMVAAIDDARRAGDSLGGVVGAVARGVSPGLGEPVFDRLDADIAKAVMSLPATKGVEIGNGFAAARSTGSRNNDPFVPGRDGPTTTTNNSGGIQGGISNGADIVVRAAFKPTATISAPQMTVTTDNQPTELRAHGRHDPCVVPRAVPLVEAALLLTLADHWLRQRAIR